ncbi:MAG: hypothetical protein ACI4NN_01325, partial [Pyramidobacter sp.]
MRKKQSRRTRQALALSAFLLAGAVVITGGISGRAWAQTIVSTNRSGEDVADVDKTDADATEGILEIQSGGIVKNGYGGKTNNGTASGNHMNVYGGGIVNQNAVGGYSESGDVENNWVAIGRGSESGAIVSGSAYGGYSEFGGVQNSFAIVDSTGTVMNLHGGYGNGNVTGSSADVKGTVNESAYGGYSVNGDVQNSFALLEQGGTVKGTLAGGGASGDVTGSSVTVSGTVNESA